MRVHFVLIAEGSSDEALIPHLQNLCVLSGATEVTGSAPEFARLRDRVGRTVAEKLAVAIRLEPSANLVFIHRDADDRDAEPRYEELRLAVVQTDMHKPWIGVVPIQATEAWLLVDEQAIRIAAYRPRGTHPLGIPRPNQIENTADPKALLQSALVRASELRGRKLDRFKRQLPSQRRLLLQQLPVGGALEQLSSWTRLRHDIAAALLVLRQENQN